MLAAFLALCSSHPAAGPHVRSGIPCALVVPAAVGLTGALLPPCGGDSRCLGWQVHTRNKVMADDVDYEVVADVTDGMSGAELANVVDVAALKVLREGRTEVGTWAFPPRGCAISRHCQGYPGLRGDLASLQSSWWGCVRAILAFPSQGCPTPDDLFPLLSPCVQITTEDLLEAAVLEEGGYPKAHPLSAKRQRQLALNEASQAAVAYNFPEFRNIQLVRPGPTRQ